MAEPRLGTGLAILMMINMSATMRRPSNVPLNILVATGGMTALFGGIAAFDPRVREQLAQIVTGRGATGELGGALAHVQQVTYSSLQVLHDQGIAYAPLTVFGIAAVVLVLFMTRT